MAFNPNDKSQNQDRNQPRSIASITFQIKIRRKFSMRRNYRKARGVRPESLRTKRGLFSRLFSEDRAKKMVMKVKGMIKGMVDGSLQQPIPPIAVAILGGSPNSYSKD
nr:hypothetical protein Iba_chr09aCG6670 [Ipomoea batatas]